VERRDDFPYSLKSLQQTCKILSGDKFIEDVSHISPKRFKNSCQIEIGFETADRVTLTKLSERTIGAGIGETPGCKKKS
jgi:hypothetical protein